MNIDIANGRYSSSEAMELVSRLVDAKIGFLQDRIGCSTSEEEIKMREKGIIQIQDEFRRLKGMLQSGDKPCEITTNLQIEMA